MKNPKNQNRMRPLALALSVWLVAGCGVRGRPLPPMEPAELGTGKPAVQRPGEREVFGTPTSPTPPPARLSPGAGDNR